MPHVKELKQFFQEKAIISVRERQQFQSSGPNADALSEEEVTTTAESNIELPPNGIEFSTKHHHGQQHGNYDINFNYHNANNNYHHHHDEQPDYECNTMQDEDDGTGSISSAKLLISTNHVVANHDNNNNNNSSSSSINNHQSANDSGASDLVQHHLARGFNYITGHIGAYVAPSEQKQRHVINDELPGQHGGDGRPKQSANKESSKKEASVKKKQSSLSSLASFFKGSAKSKQKSKKNKFNSKSFDSCFLLDDPIQEEEDNTSDHHEHLISPQSNSSAASSSSNILQQHEDKLRHNRDDSGYSPSQSTDLSRESPPTQRQNEINQKVNGNNDNATSASGPHEPNKTPVRVVPTPKPRKSLAKSSSQPLPESSTSATAYADDGGATNNSEQTRQTHDPKLNMQQMIIDEFVMLSKRQSLMQMFTQNNCNLDHRPSRSDNNNNNEKEEEFVHQANNQPNTQPLSAVPPAGVPGTCRSPGDYINWEVISRARKPNDSQSEETYQNDYYNELNSKVGLDMFDFSQMSSSTSGSMDQSELSDDNDLEEAIYETINEENSFNMTPQSAMNRSDIYSTINEFTYRREHDLPTVTLSGPAELSQQDQQQQQHQHSTPYKTIYPLDAINRIWASSSEISNLEEMTIRPIRNSSPHRHCSGSVDNIVECPQNAMDNFLKRPNYPKQLFEKGRGSKGLFKIFKKKEILAMKSGEKFGLTGLEVPLCAGVVKDDCSCSTKHDLKLKKDEVVLVLRMYGNPPGKYLAKTERGRIGYVDLSNLRVDPQSIKMIIRVYGPTRCGSVTFPLSEL